MISILVVLNNFMKTLFNESQEIAMPIYSTQTTSPYNRTG